MDWFKVCVLCACLCVQTFAKAPPGYVKPPATDKNPPKYEFGYDVKDGQGGSQGHLETREGEYALGKYYVNLPSNEQKVDYFADDWGFHPLVEYKTSSGSSSMSTQFALGEKAVAALSRQYGVAPPLEILKTKVAGSLVASVGPQVSLRGTSGIIPGPSDEPVHNSLERENYAFSTTTQAPLALHVSPESSTLRYESSSESYLQHVSTGNEASTAAPSTTGIQMTTENYPRGIVEPYQGSYQEGFESNGQNYNKNEYLASTRYNNTENYPITGVIYEGSSNQKHESQTQHSNYHESSAALQDYASTVSSILKEYSSPSRGVSYFPSAGSSVTTTPQSYEQSSVQHRGQGENQITSYIADSSTAVDVSNKGISQGLPGVSDYSPNTRISAVLVAEGGNQYEENDIRSEYKHGFVSSTTQSPSKALFKPIIVSESGEAQSPLSLFSAHRASLSGRRLNKIGKLYHREGRLNSHGGYSSTSAPVDYESQEYVSTPAPTPEPILVTPRLEAYRLTSSGNILAPIQAGLSMSAHESLEETDDKPSAYAYDVKENIPSSGPDIEKQELRKEAVYTTTVDIQKSIPFEIHPNEDSNQGSGLDYKPVLVDQAKQVAELQNNYQQNVQEGYQQNSQIDFSQSVQNVNEEISYENQQQHFYNEYNQQNNVQHDHTAEGEGYGQGEEYRQTSPPQNDYHQVQSYSGYQYPIPTPQLRPDYSRDLSLNQHNRNNFLQQVLYAYHRMANNQNIPYSPENAGYATVTNQPLYVPNRLYYIYLQRYNPHSNRYGTLYTHYRPAPTSAPGVHSPSINGENHSQDHYGTQALQSGYEPLGMNNIVYNNAVGEQYEGGEQYSSAETLRQTGQTNYVDNGEGDPSSQVSEAEKYESHNHIQKYSTQLNALSSTVRGAVIHPENQHVQYFTGQGGESNEAVQENYHSLGSTNLQQIESEEGQSYRLKYTEESDNNAHQDTKVLIKEVRVPQFVETTKLVEVEKPVPIPHPVPIEYTKIIEKPVPVAHPVPVPQTQYVEKPVPVPQPVPVEVTKIIEKPVPVPHPVPVAYTKVVAVEKPVPVPHPIPYAVTKLVAVDRPVAYPHPVPVPYPVPHPVGVPVHHLVPYHKVVPVPVKDYRPFYVYRKSSEGRLLHREPHHGKHGANFKPSQPMFASQYPPQTYEVTAYFKGPHVKGRGHGRKLRIEYGGFKPPLVPSVQLDNEAKPTYGPPAEDKKD